MPIVYWHVKVMLPCMVMLRSLRCHYADVSVIGNGESERMKMRMLISLHLAILNHPLETPPSLTTEEDNSQTVKAAGSRKVGKHSSLCTPPDLSLKHVTDFQIATSEIAAWRCCNVIYLTVRTPTQGSRTPLWKSKWLLASAAKTIWSCSLSAQRWV